MRSLILALLLLPATCFGQKEKNKRTNSLITKTGWVIHVGDTVKLGIGTLPNGDFKFISYSGVRLTNSTPWSAGAKKKNAANNALDRTKGDSEVVVDRIKNDVFYFKNYKVYANLAIKSGEVVQPKK